MSDTVSMGNLPLNTVLINDSGMDIVKPNIQSLSISSGKGHVALRCYDQTGVDIVFVMDDVAATCFLNIFMDHLMKSRGDAQ